MVDRPNKPSALSSTPGLNPQAQVSISHGSSRVTAVLPTGQSVEVHLYGATVLSWKDSRGQEQLWLSETTKLDGSKAIRGGIPLVFPVFGPSPPDHPATAQLPQHGFARTSRWEFLGKSTSESSEVFQSSRGQSSAEVATADLSVKLDFGLSSGNLEPEVRKLWPHAFGLIYSVTLGCNSLSTSLVVTNEDDKPFDFQVLFHTYFGISDINKTEIAGLDKAEYLDKTEGYAAKTQSANVSFTRETDRVYTPVGGPREPVSIVESGKKRFDVVRDNLGDVVVWNPWQDKAAGMADFGPDDGYKKMVCVEAGSVRGWQVLEPGDAFECAQTIVPQ
ncbi:uncharacterized protein E0L32_003352 [Thyridium curvatum]|uniref:Glucose-6-phosphate 1-epimerase n=1 Tax=Thyridium curvatum TaxID=1093900 RepID=A0A507BEQ1_9PEZI|nr:uncharacterized protein E0L32_003352 [Thyridium curvatum]TPX17234.1 hypothetical protein E0L32_003352 [Thyridium curvatum]